MSASNPKRKGGKDEDVGYGKPPRSGQFRKGQSGNPGGRPKGSRTRDVFESRKQLPFVKTVADILSSPVSVKTKDGTKEIRTLDAILEMLKQQALQGSVSAQRALLRLAERAEKHLHEECLMNGKEVESLLAVLHANCERALKNRGTTFGVVMHPNDVCYNPETGKFMILGPQLEQTHKRLEKEYAGLIDALLEHAALEEAQPEGEEKSPETLNRQAELHRSSIDYFLEARADQVQLWLVRFVEERLRGKCENPPEYWLKMAEVLDGDRIRVLVDADED